MKHYTLKIKPISPFMTSIESDTLFGHMCWAMEYLGIFNNEKKLSSFLDLFDKAEPPLIISNAFPDGHLPFPLLPLLSIDEKSKLEAEFLKKPKTDKPGFIRWLKRLSRQKTISVETFLRFRQSFSKYDLYLAALKGEAPEYPEEFQVVEVNHNAINRITNEVIEGKFFSRKTTFYREGAVLSVYLKTGFFTGAELNAIFGFIAINGFGGDKTTGHGRFEFELTEGLPFQEMDDFNAYLLLSNTHPSVLKRGEVYYSARTKFGKVGGEYSMNARFSPLKNPLILLEPGAVVKTGEPVDYFGENFDDVHPQLPGIRHYGIGFPVKMRLKDEI
jgi:CRISPR-associated protein Csm4